MAEHLEEVLGALLLAAMTALAFANVVTRYLIHYPIAFTEELEVNAMVWVTMLGAAAAFRKGRHLRLLLVLERLAPDARTALDDALSVLTVGVFGVLGYLAWEQLRFERMLGISSESLNLPQWIYTVGVPVGCALVVIRVVQARIRTRRGGGGG